jgi:UDP-N-acetylglucosamine--N-acetylmuramyl-(pentapeptide) pyrophosphoryl-undecaprenol N-acetylglucosamine transferase
MSHQACALVMAGGTGGHIFPGLAVAEALRARGWRVHWLGAPESMEARLVPPRGFAFEAVNFSGVRGKGWQTLLLAPWRLGRACWQSLRVLRRVQPDIVLGLGGYITVPGGLMGVLAGKPLVLHEQNSIAGMANRWLARWARRVFTAYPKALPGADWVGNPLRQEFLSQASPTERFVGRTGPLRVLVIGGSLGAKALNEVVPRALARMPLSQRPQVRHQSGERQIDALRAEYALAGVEADLTPFIQDTAQAMADADLVIARAGASTVTEVAAVGTAAAFVPFPHAVDDHQTHNARFLVDANAAWLLPQHGLTPEVLCEFLNGLDRTQLQAHAERARTQAKTEAVEAMVLACEQILTQKARTRT